MKKQPQRHEVWHLCAGLRRIAEFHSYPAKVRHALHDVVLTADIVMTLCRIRQDESVYSPVKYIAKHHRLRLHQILQQAQQDSSKARERLGHSPLLSDQLQSLDEKLATAISALAFKRDKVSLRPVPQTLPAIGSNICTKKLDQEQKS